MPLPNIESKEELRRIWWHCRRGLLELDVLLGNFFNDHYINLSSKEKEAFVTLLEYPDQVLLEWLMVNPQLAPNELWGVIRLIRTV
jgi:antitoxin CptB